MQELNVSIVIYNNQLDELMPLLKALLEEAEVNKIILIDNSEQPVLTDADIASLNAATRVEYIFCNQNLGYGKGHNIALRQSLEAKVKYHLVMNSDIHFPKGCFAELLSYMNQHPEAGDIIPKVIYPNGRLQYLCKLLPTPFDLLSRRFLPSRLNRPLYEHYELRQSGYDKIMNVPYLSGCFMLLRMSAVEQVGLFDERFFMYAEDIDYSRRMHRCFSTIFYPYITITHKHEAASYHDNRLLRVHIRSVCQYFNKYGWLFDAERRRVNRQAISSLVGK